MYLILGSNSPRRKELLANAGFKFEIVTSDVDEKVFGITPEDTVLQIAKKKSDGVFKKINSENAVVLCADTIVVLDGITYGKPVDRFDARRMINRLQGKTHTVFTGVIVRTQDSEKSFVEKTNVTIDSMSYSEVEEYVSTTEPYDKAGAYAIQGLFGKYIKNIEGDYNNVIGLPIDKVKEILNEYDFTINNIPSPILQPIKEEKTISHCSKCGNTVDKGTNFCPQCGNQIRATEAKPLISICPNCQLENKSTFSYCRGCGTFLKTKRYEHTQPWQCQVCGKQNTPHKEFCEQCGATLDKELTIIRVDENKKSNSKAKFARMSMIFGIISMAISFIFASFLGVPGIGLGITGLIFGIIGLKAYEKAQAIIGIITSSIGIIMTIYFTISLWSNIYY